MPMAADQRRKRLNGASMVVYGSPEQHRTKRKNFGPVWNGITMKSHVSLEWAGNHKRVVAKREQVGISWRQMRPFAKFVPNGHNILADVLVVPQEIFGLDNLNEVLSYEVWNTHLSEDEKNILMQFLPSAFEPNELVQELLSGDNFHFANPCVKWGASLCSGYHHPDIVVKQEQRLKSDKRAYYSQLHNYHNGMIGFLIKLKERWESSDNPEKEIVQKIWRSKDDVRKRIPSNSNEFRVYDHDENVSMTSESCSWVAEEKASSDNQISSLGQGDKLQRRVLDKGFGGKGKPGKLMVSSDDLHNVGPRPKKGDKLQKLNICSSDGDKYMSCIKVSKRQHELYKSMKLSSKSIQSKTFNHVLGDLDNIRVQPYEVFIKEEQKKLHEHWLHLVNDDLPAAYANWTGRQIQKHAMVNSLVEEMKDKSKPPAKDEDIVSSGIQIQDQEDDGGLSDESSLGDGEDSCARASENQSLHNSHLSGDDEFNHLSTESGKNIVFQKEDNASLNETEYSRDMNTQEVPISEVEAPFSPDDNVWQAVDMPHSCYDSSSTHEYTANQLSLVNPQVNEVHRAYQLSLVNPQVNEVHTANRLSLVNPQVNEVHTANQLSLVNPQVNEMQQNRLISLESDLCQGNIGKQLLPRQSGDGPFSSYQSQDQIDLLKSFFKGEGVNSYHHEQKRARLDFQTSTNVVMGGGGRFSSHLKQPLQTPLTMDEVQRRAGQVYMPEHMSTNTYNDSGRYLIPRQDPLSAVNVTDWAVNAPPRMVAPSQPQVNNGDFIDRPWFPANHQVSGGWNGSNVGNLSSQSLGIGVNSDQGLFNILSGCGQLSSASPYGSVRHNDQSLALRNYGVVDAGTPRINAVVPPSSHPLGHFSGLEAPSTLVPDNMAWMSLPHQNSALHDQMGKPPYLRSWNR
ncbi:hypothetical protein RIF29_05077 [Crotalaria pallida]|uniref:DEUBAD domain-containing protein n=1 Tax=Crotalaria pallida TaxID=3830 RepID=A0AAN9J2N6_CROPI